MSSEIRPNFRLHDADNQRCANCQKVSFNEQSAAYCMAGATDGATAEDGHRVNQNFVCDAFSAG